MSHWGALPPELLVPILELLVPKVVGWRWELHLPEGGSQRIQGDNEAISTANLVCKAWSSQAATVVTRLTPSRFGRIPSPPDWQARFRNLTSLDCSESNSSVSFIDLWPLKNLTDLSVRHSRTTQRDLADLQQLSSLVKLEILDDGADGRRQGLLKALRPLGSTLESLTLDGLTLEPSCHDDLLPFTRLESLHFMFIKDSDSLRALQAVPTLTRLGLPYTLMDTSGLSYLTALTRLQHLDMAANENVDTADVAMLTTLKVLTLEACELLDGNIEELSPLTGLTALSLSMNFHLSDLQNLQVFSGLTCLNIRDLGEIGNADLCDLQPLTSLTSLSMSCIPFTADGDFTSLRYLSSLEDLTIHDPAHSTMAALKHLPRLKELTLVLWSFSLGDRDLAQLHPLKTLRRLFIQQGIHDEDAVHVGPEWTQGGLEALLTALPHMEQAVPSRDVYPSDMFSRIVMSEVVR